MIWQVSSRVDPEARVIADRHYNRQSVGARNFVPPGRCLVLKTQTPTGQAFWITSWPYAQYVKHQWAGAWMCSAFRNEGAGVASEMILEALAATQAYYGAPPILGMVTFLDTTKVKPTRVRGVDVWGWTWRKAGFRHVGYTAGGLMAFQLPPGGFPEPSSPVGFVERHRHFRDDAAVQRDGRLLAWALAA